MGPGTSSHNAYMAQNSYESRYVQMLESRLEEASKDLQNYKNECRDLRTENRDLQTKYNDLLLKNASPPFISHTTARFDSPDIDIKPAKSKITSWNTRHIPEDIRTSDMKQAFPQGFEMLLNNCEPDFQALKNELGDDFTHWTADEWTTYFKTISGTAGKKRRRPGDPNPAEKQKYMHIRTGELIDGRQLDDAQDRLTRGCSILRAIDPAFVQAKTWKDIDQSDPWMATIIYLDLIAHDEAFAFGLNYWKTRAFVSKWWGNHDFGVKGDVIEINDSDDNDEKLAPKKVKRKVKKEPKIEVPEPKLMDIPRPMNPLATSDTTKELTTSSMTTTATPVTPLTPATTTIITTTATTTNMASGALAAKTTSTPPPLDATTLTITTDFTIRGAEHGGTPPPLLNLPKRGAEPSKIVDEEPAAAKKMLDNDVDEGSDPSNVLQPSEAPITAPQQAAKVVPKLLNLTELKKVCKQDWLAANPTKRAKDFDAYWKTLLTTERKRKGQQIWESRGAMSTL